MANTQAQAKYDDALGSSHGVCFPCVFVDN